MSTHRLFPLKYAPGPHSLKIPPNLPISKGPFGPASVINSREGSTTTQWQGKWDSISRWLQQDPLVERTACMHEHPPCQFQRGEALSWRPRVQLLAGTEWSACPLTSWCANCLLNDERVARAVKAGNRSRGCSLIMVRAVDWADGSSVSNFRALSKAFQLQQAEQPDLILGI